MKIGKSKDPEKSLGGQEGCCDIVQKEKLSQGTWELDITGEGELQ